MPPAPRKRRRAEEPARAAEPPLPKRTAPRFCMVSYPDSSLRAERVVSRAEQDREQVEADFYGAPALLSTGAHLRSAASVLTELMGQLELVKEEFAPELLAQAWQQAVGSFLSTQAELVSLVNGQAIICTAHPAVRYELQQRRRQIIQALNTILGEDCVQSVRLIHG